MKFEVKNRFSGAAQFTAEIECDENSLLSMKMGLAVKWGINNRADLTGANLSEANLCGADLHEADLSEANLCGANLCGANLYRANLYRADLSEANLSRADLSEANLSRANLCGANLCGAKNSPVVINWLEWTAFIYEDFMKIGCKTINRDVNRRERINELNDDSYGNLMPIVELIWSTVFPEDQPKPNAKIEGPI